MAGFAQHHGKSWEAELHSRLISLTPAPLQSEEQLWRNIKMHELVLNEPTGIYHGRLWQLSACCVNLPLEQWTGEVQGDLHVGRGMQCWRWRGGNEQAPA